jgi:hypothetical protein
MTVWVILSESVVVGIQTAGMLQGSGLRKPARDFHNKALIFNLPLSQEAD